MKGTILILFLYFVVSIYGINFVRNKDDVIHFMGKDYTTVLKGLSCILVMLVHIPTAYTNSLQNAVGGFSQVSVTLYFMFSAYGLIWNIHNKSNYLQTFWKNRVIVLMVPFFISCVIKMLFDFTPASGGTYFVFVLLFFYAITYFMARYIPKYESYVICIVILYSIIGRITGTLGWPTQVMGFAYGILLAVNCEKIKTVIRNHYWILLSVSFLLSVFLTLVYVGTTNRPLVIDYVLQIIMVLGLIICMLVFTFKFKIGNKLSYMLGKISYEIFLYHGLVQNALIKLDELYFQGMISSGVFVILMIFSSIFLAFIMHKVNMLLVTKIKKQLIKGEANSDRKEIKRNGHSDISL